MQSVKALYANLGHGDAMVLRSKLRPRGFIAGENARKEMVGQ